MPAEDASGLFEFDLGLGKAAGPVAGADEAGRGCFAGPLVSAAVIFDYSRFRQQGCGPMLAGLKDSKKLTRQARERLYPKIIRCAARIAVVVSSTERIDENGIHRTNLADLSRCLEMLAPLPELVLIDGWRLPEAAPPHMAVKGGDSLSACIAAASVVAKVTRDSLMRRFHGLYPAYGFNRHVGYGTLAHRQAIARHGYCPLHRRSFKIRTLEALNG